MATKTSSQSFLGEPQISEGGWNVGWWWESWYNVTLQLFLCGNVASLNPLNSLLSIIFRQFDSSSAGLNHNMNLIFSSGCGFPFSMHNGNKPSIRLDFSSNWWAWMLSFPRMEHVVLSVIVIVAFIGWAQRTRKVWFQTLVLWWLVDAIFLWSILMVTYAGFPVGFMHCEK